jgi:hypothetical protein
MQSMSRRAGAARRHALGCAAVTDLEQLYRRLEHASFSARAQIAAEVAATAPPALLADITRGLGHPHAGVRLGVIEVVRQAGHRGALDALLLHARGHDGDDRVFALRALADLARPGDRKLGELARLWLGAADPFVAAQAARLLAAVAPPADAAAPATLERLVVAAFAATTSGERRARVADLEAAGPRALAAAARLVLKKGDADLVAYLARALIRHTAALPALDALVPLLDAARKRLASAPAASAALDDALLALGPASPALLGRLDELDMAQVEALVGQLRAQPAEQAALAVPALVESLARVPALWSALGPVLVHAAPHVRTSGRAALREAAERVVDQLRADEELPAAVIVSAASVLAHVAEPGAPLPRQLAAALERLASGEAAQALAALCGRLATEDAAVRLLAMTRDPLPAARAAASAALARWDSPWITISGEPAAVVAHYHDDEGRPLMRRGPRLVADGGGEDFVLDQHGRPVRAGTTEHGGCLCCAPPRALVHPRRARLRCPATWEAHLRDGARILREADHPLGGCRRCDSVRPRIQDGRRAICLDCGAGMTATEAPSGTEPSPLVPSEHGRAGDELALPRPPPAEELTQVAAPIRTAIAANVFLRAQTGAQLWSGSGIVVARDGDHVAILTNRHVVESDDGHRVAALSAMTIAGELTGVRVLWRAARGVDLALVEGRIADPAALSIIPLVSTPIPVGARVFAIGNPLGLAWTYSAGTLSATRQWKTQDGHAVRIVQTDTTIAPGSSGGGLFHEDGALLGVISFGRQGAAGDSAHFALGVDSVREALSRENVSWRGSPLIAP